MLKKLWIILLISFSSVAMAIPCDLDLETENALRSVFKSMNADKLLSSVEATEVHFYWTSGIQRPDEVNDVVIGGTYGPRFFSNMRSFLNVVPTSVSVKLVLDPPSYNSNNDVLHTMRELFPTRFSVIFIGDVLERLKRSFPAENQKDILETIFKNAETGNPAIASDIYRTIALWFGYHGMDETATRTQLAYTDVDTFVLNMKNLTSADSKAPIYIKTLLDPNCEGHGKITNDVIKMTMAPDKRETYKKKTEEVLSILSQSHQKRPSVFNYYPKIHEFAIRYLNAKTEEDKQFIFDEYAKYTAGHPITDKDIVETTGPGLHKKLFPEDKFSEEYESAFAASWSGRTELTRYIGDPTTSLFCQLHTNDPQYEKYLEDLKKYFTNFRSHVNNAFYIRRFGETNLMFIRIVNHIKDSIPYHSEIFKNYIVYSFNIEKLEEHVKERDEWITRVFNRINIDVRKGIDGECSYYTALQRALNDLGIKDFTLDRRNIEELFTQPPSPQLAEALSKLHTDSVKNRKVNKEKANKS